MQLDGRAEIPVELRIVIEQFIKEDLSLAYVRAVAGRVNVDIASFTRDMGIDGTFRRLKRLEGGKWCYDGCPIDFQPKGSVDWECGDEFVTYDLKVRNHNILAERNRGYLDSTTWSAPFILIVFCMPREQDRWLSLKEDELLLRRCCYWHFLSGPNSQNDATERIRIPRTQLFTPQSLLELFQAVEEGTLA